MRVTALKIGLALFLIAGIVGTAGVWLIPVEFVQRWALDRAANEPFAQFEAVGQAEFLWWLARGCGPVLIVAAAWGMLRLHRVAHAVADAGREFWQVTALTPATRRQRFRSALVRIFLIGWLMLFAGHAVHAIRDRAREWPYFRFQAGAEVLPNISDSNRDVIRYLRQATPADARILVFSDQKLFFLSYYLLPRKLFHRTHPDAEFHIPLPNAPDQYAAYRRADLDADEIQKLQPDYILEYFTGSAYVTDEGKIADRDWVRFWQMEHSSSDVPDYVVHLQKATSGETP